MDAWRITGGMRRGPGDRRRRHRLVARPALLLALLVAWLGQAWSPHLHIPEAPQQHHSSQALAALDAGPHSCGSAGQAGDGRHEGVAEHVDCTLCRSSREWRGALGAATPDVTDPAAAAPPARLVRPGHGEPPEAPLLAGNPSRAPPRLSPHRV